MRPHPPSRRPRPRLRRAATAAAVAVLGSGVAVAVVSTADAAPGCRVDYRITNSWSNGFGADVTVTNLGDPVTGGWTLGWDFANGQQVTQIWNGVVSQSGARVSVRNVEWNGTIATGGTAGFGFNGTWSGTNAAPTRFTLNGTVCTGATTPTPTTSPTASPTATASPTPTPTSTTPAPPDTHVDNPFVGARGYVNPDYAAQVTALADATGGTLGAQMRTVSTLSTAVWMDRIGAITAGRGLVGHLDAALAQQAGGTPVAITVVIYDLPNRDCNALASNGELKVAENGLARYKAEYLDPIAAILARPAYRTLRIVTVIEPDSLPNLVTNASVPKCAEAAQSGAYVQGVQHALNRLHAIPNVYTYLDIGHAGWLGWDSNRGPVVQQYTGVVSGTTAGLASVDGFISNTANYTPTVEPNLPNPELSVGNPIRSAKFYEWNAYFDEADFTAALYTAFVQAGFPSTIGMLIDTSRNGWGGPGRPTTATGTTPDAYVDSGRVDRRLHRGNWCNQAGAGLGERPRAVPLPHVDAYVWVKPPGESDGISTPTPDGPNADGKQHDPMCSSTYTSSSGFRTGALDGAPHAGVWFPAQFTMLVRNAYPAL